MWTPWRTPPYLGLILFFLIASYTALPAWALTAGEGKTLALSGKYATSGGEATYTLPLALAPGRGDHQPTLSLDYQSDSPNGAMGMGWSLGGTSAIYRCGQNLRIDGRWGGVNFDDHDRYCLDGQRLIAVKGKDGAPLTEYRVEKNGYDKIISFGQSGQSGPKYFRVWRTDGIVYQYGYTADARVELPGQTEVYQWARNAILDISHNNVIQYHYEEDSGSGEHQLSKITYVGGQVTFDYESRPDKTSQFLHGSRLQRTQRLSRIRVGDASGTEVGVYQLRYQSSPISSRSVMTQMQYCPSQGPCSTPITFDWYAPAETDVFQRDKTKIDFEHVRYFDANRDGHKMPYGVKSKAETLTWCTESITNGFRGLMRDLSGKQTEPGMTGFTLQGSLDAPLLLPRPFEIKFAGQCGPKGRGSWYEYHYDEEIPSARSYQPELNGVLVDYSKQSKSQVAGDFNGDGKQTLIVKAHKYGEPLATQVLDIDNDGIDDTTYINDDYRYFHLSSNHHQAFRIPDNPYVMSLFADINHDGYLDWVRVTRGYNVLYVKYRLFNGKSFEPEVSSPALPQPIQREVYFVDVNADGYPELYVNGHF
ncbi:VCBS repeat-containing protein, partial [Vibrio navarrensis]